MIPSAYCDVPKQAVIVYALQTRDVNQILVGQLLVGQVLVGQVLVKCWQTAWYAGPTLNQL